MSNTLTGYLDQWAAAAPDETWLLERADDTWREWTWADAQAQVHAIAAWQEQHLGGPGVNVGLLSRNRPHWFFADIGSIAAGNVVVPMFTTLQRDTAKYMMEFTDMRVLFVGEAENWESLRGVLPDGLQLVCLPGVEVDAPHLRWDDLVAAHRGQAPTYRCAPGDLVSIVFTSGTTGVPKGVMQTHDSNVVPINRFKYAFDLPPRARYFSYLPLSHIAERQIVEGSSLINGGKVWFNENLTTLFRDLPTCRPHMMFGPPRVWEQLQLAIIAQFESAAALEAALAADAEAVGKQVREGLGLDDVRYALAAAAPTPPALIEWYRRLGIVLLEGFGQTEAMGLCANTPAENRIGSIGKAIGEVEVRLSEQDELQVRAGGCAVGYYKMPDKTAETFVDGWVHTGDKARIDADGFIYLTGRVKDYFKTIQGKFVAPTPIENLFAKNPHTEQICLLGRGYSKTVMVGVLSAPAQQLGRDQVAADLRALVAGINEEIDHHARIGAIVLSGEAWSIENSMLTPTLKIRREQVEEKFGKGAEALARRAAEEGEILVDWV